MTDTPISLAELRARVENERLAGWPDALDVPCSPNEITALVDAVSEALVHVSAMDAICDGIYVTSIFRAALSRFVSEQPPNGKNEKPVADETSARSGGDQ